MVWATPPPRESWAQCLLRWAPWVGALAGARQAGRRLEWSLIGQAALALLALWAVSRLSVFVQQRRAERWYCEWERKYRLPKRDYTAEELPAFDGRDPDKPILVVIRGKVFNVSAGAGFYGAHGPYNIFAGRDATWLLAKGELDLGTDAEMGKPLTVLEEQEVDGWYDHFVFKYDLLGEVRSAAELAAAAEAEAEVLPEGGAAPPPS
ncbi:cytochrome b5-like heme/steroid binding domain-containing protein [Pavlovales sp. CCMP2436]|nr:cytochrome b5-like heme/steroid binding domain-containing protein [Pavlovales sp. CCMP2436]|mmetsp:Transcript_2231/g.5547  ORF Transcript_2231/g.5547 Transcript_2231/m.5547 type:complete len:207 (+) Transcript_2231:101-721(+)